MRRLPPTIPPSFGFWGFPMKRKLPAFEKALKALRKSDAAAKRALKRVNGLTAPIGKRKKKAPPVSGLEKAAEAGGRAQLKPIGSSPEGSL